MKKGGYILKSKIVAVTVALALVLGLVFVIAGPVAASPGWNVAGTWNINVVYQSVPYPETLVLTQTGNTITGVSVNSVPPVPASAFTITGGSVSGDSVTFQASYDPNSSETTTFSGTIGSDGSMSGTWADDPGFLGRSGTWASTSGHATYTSNTSGTVMVTGNITAATVSLAYPGPNLTTAANIPFGMLVVGRNPGTGWDTTGTDYGTVTVVNNSDPNPTWTLSAFSNNDGGGNFLGGAMYCNALSRYLDNAMYVSLNNGATYNQLPTGVTLTGNVTTKVNLYAAQVVDQTDVNAGAGSYYIVVQLTASVAP
jgi:hypothetical protein